MLNPFMGLWRGTQKTTGKLLGNLGATGVESAARTPLNAGKVVSGTNPGLRILMGSPSPVAQDTASKLAMIHFPTKGVMEGIAADISAENINRTAVNTMRGETSEFFYGKYFELREEHAGKALSGNTPGATRKLGYGVEAMVRPYLGEAERPLTVLEFAQQAGMAKRRLDSRGNLTGLHPKAVEVAKFYGERWTDMMEKLSSVGLLTPEQIADKDFVASYFPQMWLFNRIWKDPNRFIDFVARNKQLEISELLYKASDPDSIARLRARNPIKEAEEFYKKIMDSKTGFIHKEASDEVYKGGGAELHRDMKIHPSLLAEAEKEWLENDIDYVFRRYIHAEHPRYVLNKQFGSVTMTKQLEEIDKDYFEKIRAAGDNKDITDYLQKAWKSDRDDIIAMRDKLLGIYQLPDNPYAIPHRISEALLKINPMRALGGVTLSSIPDLGRFVMRYGAGNTAKMLGKFITNYSDSMLSMKELRTLAGSYELSLGSNFASLTEHETAQYANTFFERGINMAHDMMGTITLINRWNHTMKSMAAFMGGNAILEAAEKAAKGIPLPKNVIAKMAESHFSIEDLKELATMPYKHVNGVRIPQSAGWKNRALADRFKAAVRNEIDTVIITPGISTRPLWMSKELGRHIGQFKSFSMTSTNAMLIPALQYHDMETLSGLMLSIFLGANVYALKQKIAGMEVNTDPRKLFMEGFDRSGISGWLMDANNILERASRGSIGMNPLLGTPGMSRYQPRTLLDTILGPTAGTIEYASKAAGAALSGDWSKEDLNAARRLLPYTNVFYMRQLFDGMEKNLADSFQLEERFKIEQRKRKAERLQ